MWHRCAGYDGRSGRRFEGGEIATSAGADGGHRRASAALSRLKTRGIKPVTARQIIIDTDPGQDDAVALLLALACPETLEVLGVTCVAGNVALDKTTRNARVICELAGRADIPVYAGCDRPLGGDLVTAAHVHGETGLDGPYLPEPEMPVQPGHAADFLIKAVRARPAGTVTLAALGPLTNIATALETDPDIAAKLREIVVMGGAQHVRGNVTPNAEFNMHVDPDAADIVFRAGIPLTLAPLDLTHKVIVTPPRNSALRAIGTPVGRAVADLTGFIDRHNPDRFGEAGVPLHDPCTIAWLLRPDLFRSYKVNVVIETDPGETRGMTVMDWPGAKGRKPNATMLHDIDADGFFDLLMERLTRL
jgi:purine nucleosidase